MASDTMANCPSCGAQLSAESSFCSLCGRPVLSAQAKTSSPLWSQNFYRIRKKVIAIANQYWIEDANSNAIGFARQKIIRIKENIPVFADDSMTQEIFRIQQEQVMDMWGTFAVVDSLTGACIGKVRRDAIKSGFYADQYFLLDQNGRQMGRVSERGGRGLARRLVPGGNLIPEKVFVEFYGQEVAEIKQQFKIIGDIWEVDCSRIPLQLDRRVLLSSMLLMGMIERDRK